MGLFAIVLSPFADSFAGRVLLALVLFLAVGVVGNALARYSSYRSHMEVGVSRTNAVVAASPIGAVLTGILLLGERPGPAVWAGVGLIVLGMVLLTSERGGGRRPLRSYLFALAALAAFSFTPYFRKAALLAMNAPWMGILISVCVANVSLLLSSRFMAAPQQFRWSGAVALGCLPAGALALGAAFNYWTSLRDGSLAVISPLIRTGPIFVLLLSALFLRGREAITPRVVGATLIVVAGAALVTAGG